MNVSITLWERWQVSHLHASLKWVPLNNQANVLFMQRRYRGTELSIFQCEKPIKVAFLMSLLVIFHSEAAKEQANGVSVSTCLDFVLTEQSWNDGTFR